MGRYAIEVAPAAVKTSEVCRAQTSGASRPGSMPSPKTLARRASRSSRADDLYRIRAGDYRIVYRIEDERLLVLVIRIGHRREIYRR